MVNRYKFIILMGIVFLTPALGFDRFGLDVKSGELSGAIGSQLSYNFSPHWQAALGTGHSYEGESPHLNRAGTNSYFLLGKYYLTHTYFSAGLVRKATYDEKIDSVTQQLSKTNKSENGISLHIGYESGERNGFHFFGSIGYLHVLGGGDRLVSHFKNSAIPDLKTVASGLSVGLGIGYYFEFNRLLDPF